MGSASGVRQATVSAYDVRQETASASGVRRATVSAYGPCLFLGSSDARAVAATETTNAVDAWVLTATKNDGDDGQNGYVIDPFANDDELCRLAC